MKRMTAKESTEKSQWLNAAREAMHMEADAVRAAADRLDDRLTAAVDMIVGHSGKVIVTGMGKSGHIGRKIAATLQSTGTPAVFLHPTEAGHGDLGVCQPGDPVIMISKSGSTAELLELEVRELFGVEFLEHPDPRNLILPDVWEGFPLRKDYEDPVNMIKL